MPRVAVALGSNLGDRESLLGLARARLRTLLTNVRASSSYETEPVGATGHQPLFLNAAVVGDTTLSARALLSALLLIERDGGRESRDRNEGGRLRRQVGQDGRQAAGEAAVASGRCAPPAYPVALT